MLANTCGSQLGTGATGTRGEERWPVDAWTGPVLAVRLSSLGDVVLATGALQLLHRRRPDLAIDVLTRRLHEPALRGLRGIRRVLLEDLPDKQQGRPGDVRCPGACEGAYAEVLDLQGGPKGRRACERFAPGARRVTYNRAGLRRRLLVLSGGRLRGPDPLVVRFAQPIAGRRLDAGALLPAVAVRSEPRRRLMADLSAGAQPESGWVLVSPAASRRLKAIPESLARTLENGLRDRGWGTIRLISPAHSNDGPEDAPAAPGIPMGWMGSDGPRREFLGTLPEVIALLSLVRAVVSSDSAILHLAAAARTPAVALFGPTVPELGFSPLGRSRVIGVDLSCRPCHVHGPRFCWLGHERCWRAMQVDRILDAVAEVAKARPREKEESGTERHE